jgi:adenylate kinase
MYPQSIVISFTSLPLAGKGTQTSAIAEKLGIPRLSSGDILRDRAQVCDEIGLMLKPIMAVGKFPADELVLSIMEERISQPDCDHGFILDGSPRTLAQIEPWDKMLAKKNMILNHVIELVVDPEILIERCTGRYNCANCKQSYHDKFILPLKANECDICHSTEFNRRSDDTPELLMARIQDDEEKTGPMRAYYEAKGMLRKVDGMQEVSVVTESILKLF